MKGGPLPRHPGAFDPNPAAHHFAEPLADGQSQARAAILPGGGGVHLAEGLEQAVQTIRRDADAGIRHGKLQNQGAEAGTGSHASGIRLVPPRPSG